MQESYIVYKRNTANKLFESEDLESAAAFIAGIGHLVLRKVTTVQIGIPKALCRFGHLGIDPVIVGQNAIRVIGQLSGVILDFTRWR